MSLFRSIFRPAGALAALAARATLLAVAGCMNTRDNDEGSSSLTLASAPMESAPIVGEAITDGPEETPPPVPPAETPEEALRLGVRFLVEAQNPDGSWGTFESARPWEVYLGTVASHRAFRDATTALCVMALQEASREDEIAAAALRRGIDYLVAADPALRATGDTFYDTWAHIYITQAMGRLHRDERFTDRRADLARVGAREIAFLAERQGADGGWGYYDFGYSRERPTGFQSTSFNTAAALLALHDASEAGFDVSEDMIHDALVCLERLRLPSGAYVYGTYAQMHPQALYNHVKGSLGRSQPCNLALWTYRRDITQDELRKGIEDFRTQHHFMEIGKGRPYPHEAWYFTAGYYFLFGHFYASRVMSELDVPAATDHQAWLAETMRRLQDPDGSWFDFPLYGFHKEYGTAFAVLTLQQSLHAPNEDLRSAR